MFRHSVKLNALLAFILSVSFLWSWAACTSLCEEGTEHHSQQNASAEKQAHNEECFGQSENDENCSMTANTAVLQERQTIEAFAPIVSDSSKLSAQKLNASWASRLPEAKQNSPPIISSTPLFVQFCNFRI